MAQRLYRQITYEVGVDTGEHGVEVFYVADVARHVRHRAEALENTVSNKIEHAGATDSNRVCSRCASSFRLQYHCELTVLFRR